MQSRSLVILRVLAVVVAGLALFFVSLRHGKANQTGTKFMPRARPSRSAPMGSTISTEDGTPTIRNTERISIPFGFDSTLPLMENGAALLASGPGACDEGEEISIVMTVTQALSGASASAEWSDTCTGTDQNWQKVVRVTSGPLFTTGQAEACGEATTRDGEGVTDTEFWCDDVSLTWTLSLPFITRP